MEENDDMTSLTAKGNMIITKTLVKDWSLGPKKATVDTKANKDYWSGLAKLWYVSEKEARRRFCANCEYFNNTPAALMNLEHIPINRFDRDGGGRGFCTKFDFICHNLRVCLAWDRKEFKDAGD